MFWHMNSGCHDHEQIHPLKCSLFMVSTSQPPPLITWMTQTLDPIPPAWLNLEALSPSSLLLPPSASSVGLQSLWLTDLTLLTKHSVSEIYLCCANYRISFFFFKSFSFIWRSKLQRERRRDTQIEIWPGMDGAGRSQEPGVSSRSLNWAQGVQIFPGLFLGH